MSPEPGPPVLLKLPTPRSKARAYPWLGLLLGIAGGVLLGHPVAMLVEHFHAAIYEHSQFAPLTVLAHTFSFHMWPMMLLYGLTGGIFGAFLGLIFRRLKEHRLLLEMVHHEFELQVATLRHHYKNLAIGIRGFSDRIRRKLLELEEQVSQCLIKECLLGSPFREAIADLEHNVGILDDAAQRLSSSLGQELLFIKALTSEDRNLEPKDLYPVLVSAIRDLLGLRFREKELRVEINGRPWQECQDSLIFPFETYAVEVILQNLLSNAMKYGDLVQVKVAEAGDWLRVEVRDNGPGSELGQLERHLLASAARQEADSTHLGLKVNLHLLEKCGGRLWVWSQVGAGATFMAEFPRRLPGP